MKAVHHPRQLMATIGKRLARERLTRNITQATLARETGIALRTLRRLEAGQPSTLDTFLRVADGLDLAEPQGYGKIEYAYYLMAEAAGISMAECRLHHEGGRSHFMTRRFDRDKQGGKVHMQSLWALEHFHYSVPPRHAYEQAVGTIRGLGMGMDDVEEQFRRAVFNVMSRNQDDHVKNISFLMDKQGAWHLAPAYDVVYACNPSDTAWTNQHQMSLAGKHDGFEADDLFQFAQNISLKPARARECIDQIFEAVSQWPDFAEKARVSPEKTERIKGLMRLNLVSRNVKNKTF